MSEETEFNLSEAANEILSDEPQEAATQETVSTSSDTQEIEPQQTEVKTDEQNAQEILNHLATEKEDPKFTEEILSQINALGAVHNGQSLKVETVNQLKEYLQKGFDYTKKTMSHSDEVKFFKEEQVKRETEWKQKDALLHEQYNGMQETIIENQIAEEVLGEMKNSDPELFEEFRIRYHNSMNRRNQMMPYMKQFETKFQKLNGELEGIKREKAVAQLSAIKQGWETDLGQTQNKYATQLAKLGVRPDWEKVQTLWKSDATNTMSVEQALFATHGKDIAQANESYKKLLATKNKTQTAMLNRTGVSTVAGGKEADIQTPYGNYEQLLRSYSQN